MEEMRIPLIGEDAPEFKSQTTQGKVHFPKDYKGEWVVLFSHPGDFTPVCTTEFMAFQDKKAEFDKRNVNLIGYSVDWVQSHIMWLSDIKEKFGVEIDFPVIADLSVAYKYWMIHPEQSSNVTVRAVFIINPDWKIAAILYYPLTTGRNIDEIIRLIDALQYNYEYWRATPANWPHNKIFWSDVIVSAPTSEKEVKENVKKYKPKTWYLSTEKMEKEEKDKKDTKKKK